MTVPTVEIERPAPRPVQSAPGLRVEEAPQSAQVLRSAGIVAAAVLLSRITGLVREVVMANLFGAGFVHDAFILGFRIPNLTRDLFAEGALASAFVPTFTSSLVKETKLQAAELANLVTTAILVIVGTLCLAGMVCAPQLVGLLAPGFHSVPGKFELAVQLTRIMFPFLLVIALAAQAAGMLNASGSFGIPAVASIFFNIGSIGCGLGIGYLAGPQFGISPIHGMAYGIVMGGALQLGWQRAKLHSLGFRFRPAWNWSHPGLRRIFGLMLPAIVGSAAMQINLMVNTSFASQISDPVRGPDGPVSWLGYALRFVQLPLGLFAAAFASAMLPSVSRSAAAKNFNEFRATLARSLGIVFLLTIPSSLALITLGRPLIGAVYQSGRFQIYDTHQTAVALACYSVGLVAYASARILSPAFYALADARTPMYISLLSIVVNVALPLFLLRVLHMNFAALALTTAVAVTLECLALAECLRRKLGGLEGRYLRDCFARITAASVVMAVPLMLVNREFAQNFPATRLVYWCELAICVPAGLLIFLMGARWFRVAEVGFVSDALVTPVWRQMLRAHAKLRS